MIPVWVLTFNRPRALNRLIDKLGRQGFRVNVFSNHPVLTIDEPNRGFVDHAIINTLNSPESNSWCARSWNTIMTKGFENSESLILLQDDTDIADSFGTWIAEQSESYDFVWGPVGDQFHYLTRDVLKRVGYWDERYIGCYCADADFLQRVYQNYDRARISVDENHGWGFHHNVSGVRNHVLVDMHLRAVDPNYQNQHWELAQKGLGTMESAEAHYERKWGTPLNGTGPASQHTNRQFAEIDWYPWFTKKHGINPNNR